MGIFKKESIILIAGSQKQAYWIMDAVKDYTKKFRVDILEDYKGKSIITLYIRICNFNRFKKKLIKYDYELQCRTKMNYIYELTSIE